MVVTERTAQRDGEPAAGRVAGQNNVVNSMYLDDSFEDGAGILELRGRLVFRGQPVIGHKRLEPRASHEGTDHEPVCRWASADVAAAMQINQYLRGSAGLGFDPFAGNTADQTFSTPHAPWVRLKPTCPLDRLADLKVERFLPVNSGADRSIAFSTPTGVVGLMTRTSRSELADGTSAALDGPVAVVLGLMGIGSIGWMSFTLGPPVGARLGICLVAVATRYARQVVRGPMQHRVVIRRRRTSMP